ncbi:nucleoporin Nup186/Nup192/Nup205 [Mycotypha africana]|uniref:nucleoporin Nup186/Nup192/Nup205 n=1 Tax=Mycotypha africana TaxID=64632 RepID=UPI002301DEF3|nr:nucleoporin Nup186/Nup192/Nup205 [Mycotypha africana]KAI8968275.1 nucleoporin Nup186/Nup192/Nup205 [Mycotypha africana]
MSELASEFRNLLDWLCSEEALTSLDNTIRLMQELTVKKDKLFSIFESQPKNEEHRKTLRSGKPLINGIEYKVNEEFINQAVFLSDQLDINEYEASRLLLSGIGKRSSSNLCPLDMAVFTYHDERGYALAILNFILEFASNDDLASDIRSLFINFVGDNFDNTDNTTIVKRLLKREKDIVNSINAFTKDGKLKSGFDNNFAKSQTQQSQPQQLQQQTSLFSQPQAQQQQPSLFGSSQPQQQPQQQASLFGSSQPQQQQGSSLFSQTQQKPSLGSQIPPQQQQQQQQLNLKEELTFNDKTEKFHIKRLADERNFLVQILYNMTHLYWLRETDITALFSRVQSANLSDASCSYILTALFAAISVHPKEREAYNWTKNDEILKKINDKVNSTTWKTGILQATVQVQWALSVDKISKTYPNIETVLSMKEKERLQYMEAAVNKDAFGFMNDYLLYFKQRKLEEEKRNTIQDMDIDEADMIIDGLVVDPNDYTKFDVDICHDFQNYTVLQLEYLAESFIYAMSKYFDNLKMAAVTSTTDLSELSTEYRSPYTTLQQFLTLLSSIYKDRLNTGFKYWDRTNGLSTFVAYLIEFQAPELFAATFEFLGAISTGEKCAPLAHNVLKSGITLADLSSSHLFSWGKLFSALHFYSKQYAEQTVKDETPIIPANEETTLCKFLYLCQQVVQYSAEARSAIWYDPILRAHESIVSMISCPTSTQLRTSLYGLLTAFCSNWGGGVDHIGEKIAIDVWQTLERSDMVIPNKNMVLSSAVTTTTSVPVQSTRPNTLFEGNDATSYAQQLHARNILNKSSVTTRLRDPDYVPSYLLPEQPSGFLHEFEDEKSKKLYTETIAVLDLLASLIHTQSKRDYLISGFVPDVSSIPFCLGSDNNRTPGIAPYISLVIDHIMSSLRDLSYTHPETKWQLTAACLRIVENSIMSFNFEPVCAYIQSITQPQFNKSTNESDSMRNSILGNRTNGEDGNVSANVQTALLRCVTHPGYDIMIRLLSGSGLLHEIFDIITTDEEKKDEGNVVMRTKKYDYYRTCLTRCLRILKRAYIAQNMFINVFMHQLSRASSSLPMGQFKLGQFSFPTPPASLRPLSALMLSNKEAIVQIALMVKYEPSLEISHLSTDLLSLLASKPDENTEEIKPLDHVYIPLGGIGSKLVQILLSSDKANEIILNVEEQLAIETPERITYDDYEFDINVIPFWLAEKTLKNVYRYNQDIEYRYPSSIRISLIDALIKHAEKDMPSPNLTEFLLGYDVKDIKLEDVQQRSMADADQSHFACLASLLSMLRRGTQSATTNKDNTEDDNEADNHNRDPFIQSHPILAEKCYQLVYKLCARESISAETLNYLRHNDNFLIEQFQLIKHRLESSVKVAEPYFAGEMISSGGQVVKTDYFTLVNALHQRAWILKLIALQLHQSDEKSTMLPLLRALYGVDISDSDIAGQLENLSLMTGYQQPHCDMLEIISSLDFKWNDGLDRNQQLDTPSKYFQNVKPEDYMFKKDGYELYDIRRIYQKLRQMQIIAHEQNALPANEQTDLEMEMGAILRRLMADNHHREIENARLHCLRAWKQVVEVTLSDCIDTFTFEARERIIYDLLTELLPKLISEDYLHIGIMKGLSEVILSLLTRLREDKRRQTLLQIIPLNNNQAVSTSGLPTEKLGMVFSLLITAILRKTCTIEIRSTLYSALINLLQYTSPEHQNHTRRTSSADQIRQQVVDIIRGEHKESLLDLISQDANQGLDDYRSTAYAALEAIYVFVSQEGDSSVLTYLMRNNFLKYAIEFIRRYDESFLSLIEHRDTSLIPLRIYEAQISLFLQFASTREGATLLLNTGILQTLSKCKFLNVRIEEARNKDNPRALERHRRLLNPILELINVMLKSLNNIQIYDTTQFEQWIAKQDAILEILKDQYKQTTLSSLYTLQLASLMVYQLSCRHDYFLGLENRGLDMIDSAMKSLISKYAFSGVWISAVVLIDKEEETWAIDETQETTDKQGKELFLVVKAEKLMNDIMNNLLAYARLSTFRPYKLTGSRIFTPIFANCLEPIENQSPAHLRKASLMTPSLTTLAACISFASKKLNMAISAYDSLCLQKENVTSLKYEEIMEVVHTAIPKGLNIEFESLNPSQQTHVLSTELARRCHSKKKELNDLKFTIENALFILWRHLEFYLDRHSISTSVEISPCQRYANEKVILHQQSFFQTSPAVINQLKKTCQTVLEPLLLKLECVPRSYLDSTFIVELCKRSKKCFKA